MLVQTWGAASGAHPPAVQLQSLRGWGGGTLSRQPSAAVTANTAAAAAEAAVGGGGRRARHALREIALGRGARAPVAVIAHDGRAQLGRAVQPQLVLPPCAAPGEG